MSGLNAPALSVQSLTNPLHNHLHKLCTDAAFLGICQLLILVTLLYRLFYIFLLSITIFMHLCGSKYKKKILICPQIIVWFVISSTSAATLPSYSSLTNRSLKR